MTDLDDVAFHNVAETREVLGYEGVRLQRVPEDVRRALNEDAAERMLVPTASEVRFVPESPSVSVALSAPSGSVRVQPFWGPYQGEPFTVGHDAESFELAVPEKVREGRARGGRGFAPRVCRLICRGASGMRGDWLLYHGVEGETRPPEPDEVPDTRYLAYGTSITEDGSASEIHLTYASLTARRLGADLLNLGCSGSAHCEAAIADHIAARDDWDVATLSVSVNMLGFDIEEFRERAAYLVDTVAAADPDRPVVAVTLFENEYEGDRSGRFREALVEAVEAADRPNLSVLSGPSISEASGLSADAVHPGDAGHATIAEGLAPKLRRRLAESS
ncbi:MAG: SGNH/GDSL hydrolase family protein [Halosimplex sp.]